MAGTEETLAQVFGDLAQTVAALALGTVLFEPAESGTTQLGGLPRLSAEVTWPTRPEPQNAADIAARAGKDYKDALLAHLKAELPFSFVAQIDLADVAQTGVETGLPDQGQLLFFYDMVTGYYDNGTGSAAVIWDQGASAFEVSFPDALIAAEQAQEPYESGLRGPEARYDAIAALSLPGFLDASFEQVVPVSMQQEIQDDGPLGQQWSSFNETHSAPPFQIGGYAMPQQDDPRYEVQSAEVLGTIEPSSKNNPQDWRLLLQVSLQDYLQQPAEGTVYFLIHVDDLAARRFENVVAIYQQS